MQKFRFYILLYLAGRYYKSEQPSSYTEYYTKCFFLHPLSRNKKSLFATATNLLLTKYRQTMKTYISLYRLQICKSSIYTSCTKVNTHWNHHSISLREFDIRTLRNKPAFVNDVDIHRRLFRQKVVRNKACNQV